MPLSKSAVQSSEPQHLPAVLAGLIDMAGKLDLRLGERAGLVGAEDVHGAEIVDRGKALHDHAARREPPRAIGERHGDHHRQKLGREANGKGERKQQRFEQGPVEHHIGDRDEQHEEHGQPQHQESELADAALERIAWPLHGQSMGKPAELGRAPGADDRPSRCR